MASSRRVGTNENISTFGAAGQGRDYTDKGAWEAATGGNLVSLQISQVLECYNDTLPFNQGRVGYDGATTNATYFRIIRPAPGQGHNGIPGTGVTFERTTGGTMEAVNEPNFCLQDIAYTMTVNTTATVYIIQCHGANSCGVGVLVADGSNTGTGYLYGYRATASLNPPSHFVNCLAHNIDGSGSATQNNNRMYNCTSTENEDDGYAQQGTGGPLKNCLGSGNQSQDFRSGSWNAATEFNASSDGSAPGTNSRTNQTFTFVDAPNDDFHLAVTDAGARNHGTDLSSDSTLAFDDDVDFELFDVWDIGFDEPQPPGGVTPGVGSSVGVATTTGVGRARVSAVGTSPGVATVAGVGRSVYTGVGASSGSATTTGVGQAIVAGVGASAGIATTSGTGRAVVQSVASSDGIAVVVGFAPSASGAGFSAGVATVLGTGAARAQAVASSDGSAITTGVGLAKQFSAASAVGEATVGALGLARARSVATSAGLSLVMGVAEGGFPGVGISQGQATVLGVGRGIGTLPGVGNAAGQATVFGIVIDASKPVTELAGAIDTVPLFAGTVDAVPLLAGEIDSP